MENDFELNLRDSDLKKLNYILNYELSTGVLFILSSMTFIFLFLSALAAAVFTPFLLYVLIKERKTGWIIFFIILIILPPAAALLLFPVPIFSVLTLSTALGGFYLYCFLFKMSTREWLQEESAAKELSEKRRLKKFLDSIYLAKFKK